MPSTRAPYSTDVSDEEWALVAPYLTLLAEDAGQRKYPLREVFIGLRYIVKTGAHWHTGTCCLTTYRPGRPSISRYCVGWPLAAVENIVHDLRILLHRAQGRHGQPTAAVLDSRTIQPTPESGHRRPMAMMATSGAGLQGACGGGRLGRSGGAGGAPTNVQDREQVAQLSAAVPGVTGEHVELAWVAQGSIGNALAQAPAHQGIELAVVKLPEAKRGFVLLPRR